MSTVQLVSFYINNSASKGSRYLQLHLLYFCLFFIAISVIINEIFSHPITMYLLIAGLIGLIVFTTILFTLKKQADKITIETNCIRLHYSNLWGKKYKKKIFFKGLKYEYIKHNKINFISPRSLIIYPLKERKISFDTGKSGWKGSDLQEIARLLVTRGVYNKYKFDKKENKD